MKQNNSFENESFEELFKASLSESVQSEGVVKGVVTEVGNTHVTVDVGLKSEGRIAISEFKVSDEEAPKLELGQHVDVYIIAHEGQDGSIVLSREKARREENWKELEDAFAAGRPVEGIITKKVKGGLSAIVGETTAFLPASQVDVNMIKNMGALVGTKQNLQILKMDKKRYNIVVSRKALTMQNNENAIPVDDLREGQVLEGFVKNITGYGVFIDLGSVDGLLHLTDISWSRVNHPSEILQLGQTVKVKIIKINPENKRISLGIKQLTEDPWLGVIKDYQIGNVYNVKVTNITDYGVFVELNQGVEGLVHISEISWSKNISDIRAIYSIGDVTDVKVIDIDVSKRRINLSIKQCIEHPWSGFKAKHKEGDVVEVKVKSVVENGLVILAEGDIEGFVRAVDLSWELSPEEALKNYKEGDVLKVIITKNDPQKEKVALSVKHLEEDPMTSVMKNIKKGAKVTGTVLSNDKGYVEVDLGNALVGVIKPQDLGIEKEDKDPKSFEVGAKIDALVVGLPNNNQKNVNLSIKAYELSDTAPMSTGDDNTETLAHLFEAINKKD